MELIIPLISVWSFINIYKHVIDKNNNTNNDLKLQQFYIRLIAGLEYEASNDLSRKPLLQCINVRKSADIEMNFKIKSKCILETLFDNKPRK